MRPVEAGATLMRYRQLGASGLLVSVLTMGTTTFGGS
jgi:aryl-alcohol dehydrogenase-like predicted oxidoreductase